MLSGTTADDSSRIRALRTALGSRERPPESAHGHRPGIARSSQSISALDALGSRRQTMPSDWSCDKPSTIRLNTSIRNSDGVRALSDRHLSRCSDPSSDRASVRSAHGIPLCSMAGSSASTPLPQGYQESSCDTSTTLSSPSSRLSTRGLESE